MGAPQEVIPRYIDMPSFLRWLSYRQCVEGGFAGRTNKLVDGCYSHWVGGSWSFIDAALIGAQQPRTAESRKDGGCGVQSDGIPFSDWLGKNASSVGEDLPEAWPRAELTHYILYCCQSSTGGLVDKPGVRSDAYHTLYNLAGLSAAQNRFFVADSPEGHDVDTPRIVRPGDWKFIPLRNPATPTAQTAEFAPESGEGKGEVSSATSSRVKVFNPVYVIPWGVPERTWKWYSTREWRTETDSS